MNYYALWALLIIGLQKPLYADAEVAGEGSKSSPEPVMDEVMAAKAPITPPPKKALASDQLELKLAKLWARVDGMSRDFLVFKQKLYLLEKGLSLGLMPEGLKKLSKSANTKKSREDPFEVPLSKDWSDQTLPTPEEEPKVLTQSHSPEPVGVAEEERLYPQALAQAQGLFSAANYGEAILAFTELNKKYNSNLTQGSPLYWIGMAWLELKEAELAEKNLSEFIKSFPQNPQVPRAKLGRAKAQKQRGLRTAALKELQGIILEYPENDIQEMAELELKALKNSL